MVNLFPFVIREIKQIVILAQVKHEDHFVVVSFINIPILKSTLLVILLVEFFFQNEAHKFWQVLYFDECFTFWVEEDPELVESVDCSWAHLQAFLSLGGVKALQNNSDKQI